MMPVLRVVIFIGLLCPVMLFADTAPAGGQAPTRDSSLPVCAPTNGQTMQLAIGGQGSFAGAWRPYFRANYSKNDFSRF
jgi:hypothetical protein